MDGRAGELPGGSLARLKLWVRQHAWLHTPPRRGVSEHKGPAPQARIVALEAQAERGEAAPALDLPDPEESRCLLDWLFEAGLMHWTETGPRPLSWGDLHAWQTMTGTALTSWQATAIASLSAEYASGAAAALDANCPSPIAPVVNQDALAAQITAVMAMFGAHPDGMRKIKK